MNPKAKLIVDVVMIIGMFLSMSLHLFGAQTHKMIGLLTFLLFVVHNLLNKKLYKGLFKGKYSTLRTAHTITNLAVILAVTGIMVSGVMLSKEMAGGLVGSMTAGRILHNVCSYTI